MKFTSEQRLRLQILGLNIMQIDELDAALESADETHDGESNKTDIKRELSNILKSVGNLRIRLSRVLNASHGDKLAWNVSSRIELECERRRLEAEAKISSYDVAGAHDYADDPILEGAFDFISELEGACDDAIKKLRDEDQTRPINYRSCWYIEHAIGRKLKRIEADHEIVSIFYNAMNRSSGESGEGIVRHWREAVNKRSHEDQDQYLASIQMGAKRLEHMTYISTRDAAR